MADRADLLLRAATRELQQLGIATAALDARLLLQAATGLSHAEFIAEPQTQISDAAHQTFQALMQRRMKFEPVSRILGEREFYGRSFRVTPAVLDPRPDTEVLIDAVLAWAKTHPVRRLIDLGTGSGILAVTLLAEMPDALGVATDVSPAALAIAQENAKALGVAPRLKFVESHWWQQVEGTFDLVVSNPPYIPAGNVEGLAVDVKGYDPHLALAGGRDGLDPYRALSTGLGAKLGPAGACFVEIGAGQERDVEGIFLSNGFKMLGEWRDLGGHIRVLGFCCFKL